MKNFLVFITISISIGCTPKSADRIFKSKAGKFQIEYKNILSEKSGFEGCISDSETNEPLPLVSVALYENKVLITGTETDFDGNFKISPIDTGFYDLEFSWLGYNTLRLENIEVKNNRTGFLTVKMCHNVLNYSCCMGCPLDWIVPLIEQDNTTQG